MIVLNSWEVEGPRLKELTESSESVTELAEVVLEATGIHQVLAWDITLIPGPVHGQFYYLYMVMDVWSRRILGVEVHDRECGELAKHFFERVCRDEGISSGSTTILHADNGAPMRSYTLAAKMAELGISLSFSRPRVSNDNAYAE